LNKSRLEYKDARCSTALFIRILGESVVSFISQEGLFLGPNQVRAVLV